MRTEYMLTTSEKAALADIDRQIEMLCLRKLDIYTHAHTRYIMETPEEIKAAQRLSSMSTYGYGLPVIQKEGIVKIVTDIGKE